MKNRSDSELIVIDMTDRYLRGPVMPVTLLLSRAAWEAITNNHRTLLVETFGNHMPDLPLDQRIKLELSDVFDALSEAHGLRRLPPDFDPEDQVPF